VCVSVSMCVYVCVCDDIIYEYGILSVYVNYVNTHTHTHIHTHTHTHTHTQAAHYYTKVLQRRESEEHDNIVGDDTIEALLFLGMYMCVRVCVCCVCVCCVCVCVHVLSLLNVIINANIIIIITIITIIIIIF